jgi:uncharacterized DUF497 family protein
MLARTYFRRYKKAVEIEHDPAKDRINIAKHGVSLSFGGRVFDDPAHIVIASIRAGDGEERYKAIGVVDGRLWTAVHVVRGDVTRFMSVRRSNNGERKIYDRA